MDIVERLREWPISVKGPFTAELCNEAANKIERLHKLIKNLVDTSVGGDYGEVIVEIQHFDELAKEVCDE